MAEPGLTISAVLVVGDVSSPQGRLVCRVLAGLDGVHWEAVAAWTDASASLAAGRVELLVVLLSLNDLNQQDFLAAVGELPGAASVPIVVVGGEGVSEDVLDLLESPMVADLILPGAGEREVAARIRAAVHCSRRARSLAQRGAELEALVGRQSEFLSLVSHEIRTPLSGIQSAANILLRYGRQRPEAVERFARVIHQEGRRLTRLINNLLDLAKIEAGQVEWHFEVASPGDLLDRVQGSFAALARERGVTLTVTAAGPLDGVELDRDKMVQVLANLVSNALKVAPAGSEVKVQAAAAAQGGLRLQVEDQGPGIPIGMEEEVFGRFKQLESGEETGGTGLGLTISRQIVERHGGRIWVEPGRAQGACFVVELPLRRLMGQDHGPVR